MDSHSIYFKLFLYTFGNRGAVSFVRFLFLLEPIFESLFILDVDNYKPPYSKLSVFCMEI